MQLVSLARAARLVGLDPRGFKKLLDRGKIPTIQTSPSRRMINLDELHKYFSVSANSVAASRAAQTEARL